MTKRLGQMIDEGKIDLDQYLIMHPRYIKGESEASKQLYEFVSLVAPTPMSVWT